MAPKKPAKAAAPARKREGFATQVEPELLNRARNAAYWLRLPLATIMENALSAEVAKLEKKNGKAFQQRPGELTRGARPK